MTGWEALERARFDALRDELVIGVDLGRRGDASALAVAPARPPGAPAWLLELEDE